MEANNHLSVRSEYSFDNQDRLALLENLLTSAPQAADTLLTLICPGTQVFIVAAVLAVAAADQAPARYQAPTTAAPSYQPPSYTTAAPRYQPPSYKAPSYEQPKYEVS